MLKYVDVTCFVAQMKIKCKREGFCQEDSNSMNNLDELKLYTVTVEFKKQKNIFQVFCYQYHYYF